MVGTFLIRHTTDAIPSPKAKWRTRAVYPGEILRYGILSQKLRRYCDCLKSSCLLEIDNNIITSKRILCHGFALIIQPKIEK